MRHVFERPENCCGCTACYSVCGQKAISMRPDSEGFFFPEIDEKICINCGLCKKVCDFNKRFLHRDSSVVQHYWGFKHENQGVLNRSSSGGAFTALSDAILERKGLIYGAAYDTNLVVRHEKATNKMERNKMCGSKYVQSHLGSIFQDVKEALITGKIVLFSGTPCQVAGLKSFLEKDYENLFTVDMICHGVVTPLLFKEYLCFVEKRLHKKIIAHDCRSKYEGWCHKESNKFSDGTEDHCSRFSQLYRRLFYSDYATRYSCYHCRYANKDRVSDITLGDFWGVDKEIPDFYNKNGVSLLLVNSKKGACLMNSIKASGECVQTSLEQVLPRQPQLQKPISKPLNRNLFWEIYEKKGFYSAIRFAFFRPVHECLVDSIKTLGIFEIVAKIFSKS